MSFGTGLMIEHGEHHHLANTAQKHNEVVPTKAWNHAKPRVFPE
jgi:hypothetical protein